MKENIFIFGASGHAKVIIDILEKGNLYNILGLIGLPAEIGKEILGYNIIGSEQDLLFLMKKYNVKKGIIAIGNNNIRKKIVQKILTICSFFSFINAIHPTAYIGKNVKIGIGNVIMPNAVINANTVIENHCIINTSSIIEHDNYLSSFCSIAPSTVTGGGVYIGENSTIYLGVKIIPKIKIGKNVVVGAGSLVLNDILDNILVFGAPAKNVRKIN